MRRGGTPLATGTLAVFLAACGAGERAWDARCEAELAALAAAARRAPANPTTPFLDWGALRNPVLALPDRSLKDQAIVYRDGAFTFFASTRFEGDEAAGAGDAARTGREPLFYRTRDFVTFEPLREPDGTGAGSPDLIESDGVWTMTFQRRSAHEGGATGLYFSTSRDLVSWSPARELGPEIVDPALRNLDAALARHGGHFILGWKRVQSFVVTRSLGPELDGRWLEPLPVTAPLKFGPNSLSHDWAENFQFLEIDGRWHMVATAKAPGIPFSRHIYTGSHESYLYTMDGSGDALEDWTHWRCKRLLEVPQEDWNQAMHANAGYLADWREHDGHFYLFYAGANDHESFERRGHGKIGVVRSRDLVHWKLPGEMD